MTRDDIIRLACGYTSFEPRWYESIEAGDFIAEKLSGDVAIVMHVLKQRPLAPDYFRLDFADGSRVDHTDNHLSANYRPYVLPSKIAAAEREECERLKHAMREAMHLLDQPEPRPHAAFSELLLALNPNLPSAIHARGESK